ncbi:MAG: NAD-dependent epimerase/dehydratase family protein [Lacisediminihabitans sp.]
MSTQLVIGAGLIGQPLAERLAARGDSVTIATRSGSAAVGASSLVLDATDAAAAAIAASGAETIFLCSNPAQYHRWPMLWPPIFAAVVAAAAASGARLVIMGNLYAYGETAIMPMAEHSPLLTTETKGLVRKAGWQLALTAYERGELQAVEVRASDYFGPGSKSTAHLGGAFFGALLAGKTARVIGSPDMPHSWSYLPDIVTTLIAAADYRGEWGRAWHVPSGTAIRRTEIARQANAITGLSASVASIPQWALGALGLASPLMRSIRDSSYQFTRPFILDSTETEGLLGVRATPWADALRVTLDSYRQ